MIASFFYLIYKYKESKSKCEQKLGINALIDEEEASRDVNYERPLEQRKSY